MHFDPMRLPTLRVHRALRLVLMSVLMAGIFVADTTTRYEVAVAVFYTVIIFTEARVLQRRRLIALAAICIVMTIISFVFTPHGDLRAGLINMGISITAIVMISFLILKAETAQAAAHEAQTQLMRIARAKNLEGLTTSIAHEVNQPLAAIVTSGHAAQRWLAQDPPNLDKAREALARMLADAGRASTIIVRVRSLTRGEPPNKATFAFNQAILEIIALSRDELERRCIDLETNLADELPFAFADRIQIQQVIGNLLLNAVEALEPVPIAARRIRISSTLSGDIIVFELSDSGPGIANEMRAHVFETFWTTKDQGIGVGLSISRTLIEANGGRIWIEPSQDDGATFRFSLPAATQEESR